MTSKAPQDQDVTDSDDETVPVPQVVTIDLDKAGTLHMDVVAPNGRADVGDQITYTFDITNTGNVTLHAVTLSDATVAEDCGTFARHARARGVRPVRRTFTLTQADIDAGFVDNTANVTAEGPLGTADPADDAADEDAFSVAVPQVVTIDVDKVATLHQDVVAPSGRVDAGDTISYAFTVTNAGNVTLHDVVVTDPLTGLSCPVGTLAPAAVDSTTCSAIYTLLQADVDAGHRGNTATVTAQGPQDQAAQDTDTEDVTLPQVVTISLNKVGTRHDDVAGATTQTDPGDTISYTFHQEHGQRHAPRRDAVRRLSIAESCGAFDGTLDPGESVVCTATRILTQADIDAGEVVNTADVSAEGPLGGETDSADARRRRTPRRSRSRRSSRSTSRSRARSTSRRATRRGPTRATSSRSRSPSPTPAT